VKRFRPSARRLISLAAAGVAGIAATMIIATPASAHHTNVSGVASCAATDASGWTVAWTVTSFTPTGSTPNKWDLTSISQATLGGSGDAVTGQLAGPFGSTPGHFVGPGKNIGESFTGSQHFPNSVTWVTLTANGVWNNNTNGTGTSAQVNKPTNCTPATSITTTAVPVLADAPVTTTPAGLPVTGSSVSSLVGAGAGLLVLGAGLIAALFLMRRRRTSASG
jgi:hypothetical protein